MGAPAPAGEFGVTFMTRIFLIAAGAAIFMAAGGTGAARAECATDGLLALCPDDTSIERARATDEDDYQRLDGGGYGGRPATSSGNSTTYTLDDGTTVTLGTAAPNEQPWTAFDRKTGDAADFKREDEARGGDLNPLNKVCGADGCR